ncbi:MAG: ATP-binding protein [Rhodocyclaceae bacterium]|nr:ATP-binding protein [Rhodocyclaceae bacterium]
MATGFSDMDMMGWIRDMYALSQASGKDEATAHVAASMLDLMTKGFAADGGYLALPPEEADGDDVLRVAACHDIPGLTLGTALDLREGMLASNPEAAGAAATSDVQKALRESDAHSIFLPLIAGDLIVGALRLHRRPERAPFGAEDWDRGGIMVAILSLVIDNRRMHVEQRRRIGELSRVNSLLEDAHTQLLQSEKMASIGQLAAGVAHEINTPIGYVHSNLGSLESYIDDVFRVVDAYADADVAHHDPKTFSAVRHLRQELDIDFLKEDARALLSETRDGITRVKKIVQDLKNFSHPGRDGEWGWEDLHACLDGTLNIVSNEIKYKAQVVRNYGKLPPVPCDPTQISQVFLNLLVNAAHAIEKNGTITLTSREENGWALIEISDTGSGIRPEHLNRIFDPFFTTKPVGKGTGLGLSLSYSIMQKHGGRLEVVSQTGVGSTFRVFLPLKQLDGNDQPAPRPGTRT